MKLKLRTLEKITAKATAKEIDFLLYTLQFQNSSGIVEGITKNELMESISISKGKYYGVLKSLEQKNIIEVFWNNNTPGFWSFRVLDNVFWDEDDYKQGYININIALLHTKAFLDLKKAEKVICLNILSLYRESRKTIKLTFETLMKWTGKKLFSVKKYVVSLKGIFKNIFTENNMMTVIIQDGSDFKRLSENEKDVYNEHKIKSTLKLKKINAPDNAVEDTVNLFRIFERKFGSQVIFNVINNCLNKYKALIPKNINFMLNYIKGSDKVYPVRESMTSDVDVFDLDMFFDKVIALQAN